MVAIACLPLLIPKQHNHGESGKQQEQPHGRIVLYPVQVGITRAEHKESESLSGEREIYEEYSVERSGSRSLVTDFY